MRRVCQTCWSYFKRNIEKGTCWVDGTVTKANDHCGMHSDNYPKRLDEVAPDRRDDYLESKVFKNRKL